MIKRRSLERPKRISKKSKSKSKRRSRRSRRSRKKSRNFGKISKTFETTDPVFNLFSNFVNPKDLLKLLVFTNNLSDNAFNQKPDETIGLHGPKEHFEKLCIWWFRKRIDSFVENITPAQIVLLTQGKYNNELTQKIFHNTDSSPLEDESRISGIKENTELVFLKSIFAKNLISKIKLFLKSLSNTQFVLLINGKYDIFNSMFNAFLNTKYPTKIDKKEIEKLEKETLPPAPALPPSPPTETV